MNHFQTNMKSWLRPCFLLLSGTVTFMIGWFLMPIVYMITKASLRDVVLAFLFLLPFGVIALSFALIVCCLAMHAALAFLLTNRQQLLFISQTACCSHFIFTFGMLLFVRHIDTTVEGEIAIYIYTLVPPFCFFSGIILSVISLISSVLCAFVAFFAMKHGRKRFLLKVNGMFEKMMQFPFRVWAGQALISFVLLVYAFICEHICL
jgi:hypothetical protein